MKKKVIALIRTSTTAQEVESQRKEVMEAIIADGYNEADIIVVGQAGASAIKVDEAYLQNLQKVYDLVDGGNITAVYAWAIDRIGRNEDQLIKFKNKMIESKVQVVIKNPSLKLLQDDGTVNDGMEIAFNLFMVMAKQEMLSKKARFARAKKRNAEQGRYNGGKIHFGYNVDESGRFVINEEEAEVVRLLYNLYKSGEYSTTTLTRELQQRGYKMRGKAISLHFVTNMLKTTAFIGYTTYNGVRHNYPRIISDDLFNSAQQRLKANRKGEISRQSRHINLCTKLIVCPTCGRHWFASNRSYSCIGHKYHDADLQGYGKCPNSDSISSEWVDVAVWSVAKAVEIDYIYNETESKDEEAQRQMEVNKQKIEALRYDIANADNKRRKIGENYENDIYDEKEYKSKLAKVKSDIAEYRKQIVTLEQANRELSELADYFASGTLIHLHRLPFSGINEQPQETYQTIRRHIQSVTVTPITYKDKIQKLITITTKLGKVAKILYLAKSKAKDGDKIFKLFKQDKNGEFCPIIAYADFVAPYKDIDEDW